ncbi:MAG TPA: Ig-like domain-containing protein [Marinobacter sp.]|uniref:Ig-like domain-containing protein n=1 Tax=Marinobacter sp. TaxID=50741 RepID=UPI002D7E4BAA|nr:Ig-like domain-containing protein [Marinobacter sp.]HET8801813.1 Ig-like domain-containing protein [Marinobacter sp.]
MSGKIIVRVSALLLTLMLAACGGDSGSSSLSGVGGSNSGNTGGTDNSSETATVGAVQLINESPQISTDGSDSSLITAIVKDSSGRVMEDVNVSFAANNDGTILVQTEVTGANGQATALVSAGNNPRNRTITVTVTAGSAANTTTVTATGTMISITGPSSIVAGASATYTTRLIDADNNPIVGENISVSTKLGNQITNTPTFATGLDGTVTFDLVAQSGGSETITVAAYSGESTVTASKVVTISPDQFSFTSPAANQEIELNTPQELEVEWLTNGEAVTDGTSVIFETTRGVFVQSGSSTATVNTLGGFASADISSISVGPASVTARSEAVDGPSAQRTFEFVSTTPAQLNLQADKTQIGQNDSAVILATVRDSNNNLVKNATVNFTLDDVSGGSLSAGSGETNSQGQTQVTYTSSSVSSALDGVTITATVPSTTLSENLSITVGGQALRINIGTGNEIVESGPTLYKQPWTAIVTDANGNASENRSVQVSVIPVRYFKGMYTKTTDSDPWIPAYSVAGGCVSEDINNNGILDDADSDENGNGTLEPAPSATVPMNLTTGADGTVTFDLTYLKSECSWIEVDLIATTSVQGTESQAQQRFTLACTANDLEADSPPGGANSPYGVAASCANPN